MTSIKPLGDRVVVQPKPAEEKTESGLYIPDSAKEKPQEALSKSSFPAISAAKEASRPHDFYT